MKSSYTEDFNALGRFMVYALMYFLVFFLKGKVLHRFYGLLL